MREDAFAKAALALPGATCVVQWGGKRAYKVGDRMFALMEPDGTAFSIKVSDIAFAALVEGGRARPAPYLARAKWVRFEALADLEAAEVRDWLATAHVLVAAKLTRAERKTLGLRSDP